MPGPIVVAAAVEGIVDEAVLGRIAHDLGASLSPVHGKNGKPDIHRRLVGFNQAARFTPWIVLVDLNSTAACAPALRTTWLPRLARMMCFSIAVHQIEAWLLADAERTAGFLGVSIGLVPTAPEGEPDAKQAMVNLARRSAKREIRDDMVPRQGAGRAVGPAYSSRLIEFATRAKSGWRPKVAAERSQSLARCIDRLARLVRLERDKLAGA